MEALKSLKTPLFTGKTGESLESARGVKRVLGKCLWEFWIAARGAGGGF